jgi:hypothetical protein
MAHTTRQHRLGRWDLEEEMRLHNDSAIGNCSGHHRHFQWRRLHIVLTD